MGAAVKPMRGRGRKKRPKPAGERAYKSPLDRAAGWEVNWKQVTPVFNVAQQYADACFVYVIGEENGPLKIGSAKDPILRLRGLQTGNPRRLQIEYVLLGDGTLERLLHELWEPFAIKSKRAEGKVDCLPGTEWFTEDVRERLEPILCTAAERQVEAATEAPDSLSFYLIKRFIREAHAEHGFTFKGRDQARLLGAHGGYVTRGRRSRL